MEFEDVEFVKKLEKKNLNQAVKLHQDQRAFFAVKPSIHCFYQSVNVS